MIICPPIAVVYICSYCTLIMIHASDIWAFMLLALGDFIKCKNMLDVDMGASILSYELITLYV
jgi:hypothetical protein